MGDGLVTKYKRFVLTQENPDISEFRLAGVAADSPERAVERAKSAIGETLVLREGDVRLEVVSDLGKLEAVEEAESWGAGSYVVRCPVVSAKLRISGVCARSERGAILLVESDVFPDGTFSVYDGDRSACGRLKPGEWVISRED